MLVCNIFLDMNGEQFLTYLWNCKYAIIVLLHVEIHVSFAQTKRCLITHQVDRWVEPSSNFLVCLVSADAWTDRGSNDVGYVVE